MNYQGERSHRHPINGHRKEEAELTLRRQDRTGVSGKTESASDSQDSVSVRQRGLGERQTGLGERQTGLGERQTVRTRSASDNQTASDSQTCMTR